MAARGATPTSSRPSSPDLEPGEAVLVEFGRRQALGIILGDAPPPEGITAKPIAGRVRADGPLLPPLALAFAGWIADHYLAPPALVLRAMLPPGLLERLELAGRADAPAPPPPDLAPADRDLLDQLERGPRPIRDLVAAEGRAALVRRLRVLEEAGRVTLDWTLLAAGAGPRYERWIRLTADGRSRGRGAARAAAPAAGPSARARPRALAELRAADPPTACRCAGSASAMERRRGEPRPARAPRDRGPRAPAPSARRSRRSGSAAAGPSGAALTPPQAAAVALVREAIAAGDPTPLLLDGVTGGGKTAIYVEAIVASLERGRPALVLVPEIALAMPLVDRLRSDLGVRVALVHSGLGDGERADEWRRIRAGDVDIVVGTRLAIFAPLADVGLIVVDEEHDAAYKSDRTPRIQARDGAVRLAELAGAAIVLGSATPAVESVGRARDGVVPAGRPPSRPTGARPSSRSSTCARS